MFPKRITRLVDGDADANHHHDQLGQLSGVGQTLLHFHESHRDYHKKHSGRNNGPLSLYL